MNLTVISASVRAGRKSHRVALYFKNFIESNGIASVEVLDLQKYGFPVFEERLKFQKDPLPAAIEFAEKIKKSDGVIIVTPEYNGGYPASLKNVIDLLTDEWKKKPVAISTESSGSFGGMQAITSLQFSLWKLHAVTAAVMFPVPKVSEAFDEEGNPHDKESSDKRAKTFVEELIRLIKCNSPAS